MTDQLWQDVDTYLTETLIDADAALDGALAASEAAGLPAINVTPSQGKLLQLMARAQGARAILEVGTLGGYSTIWLARALPPGGRLITLEANAHHAEVARENLTRAGLSDVVQVRVGPALETLPVILAERPGPFDFFFIDADKPNNAAYFRWALALSRPGSVIVVDNVVRRGAVVDALSTDPDVQGARRLHEAVAAEPRVAATVIQTVGGKGHDGFTFAVVTD